MKGTRGNTREKGHDGGGTRAPKAVLALGLGLLAGACTNARDERGSGHAVARGGVPMRVTLPRVDPAAAARAGRSFALQVAAMTYHPWHVALRVTGPNGYSQAIIVKPGQSEVALEVPVGTVKVEGVVLGMPLPVGKTLAEMCSSRRFALQTVTDASRATSSPSGGSGSSGNDGSGDVGNEGIYVSTVSTSVNVTTTTAELPVSFAPLKYAPGVAFGLRLFDGVAPVPGAVVRFVDGFAHKPILDPCTGEPFTATADAKGRIANGIPHAEGARNAIAMALPRGQVAPLPLDSSNAAANFFDVNVATGSVVPMPAATDFFGLGSALADLAARHVDLTSLLRRAENLQRNNAAFEGNLWIPGMVLPAPKAFLRAPSNGIVGPFSRLDCRQEAVRLGAGTNVNQRVAWRVAGRDVGLPDGGGSFYVPKDARAGDEVSCRVQLGEGDGSNNGDTTKWGAFGEAAFLRVTTSDPQPIEPPEFLAKQDPLAASLSPLQGGGLRVAFTPSLEGGSQGANYKVVWRAGGAIPATCEGDGIQRYRNPADVKAIDIPGTRLGGALGASFGVRICAANYIDSLGREVLGPGVGATGSTATSAGSGATPLPDAEGTGPVQYQGPGVTSFTALAIGGNAVRLKWDAPSTVTKFRVEMMAPAANGWISISETTAKEFEHAGLYAGARYSFRIVSLDAQGNTLSTSWTTGLAAPWFTPFSTRGEAAVGLPAGGGTFDAAIWMPKVPSGESLIAVALSNGVAVSRDKGNGWNLASTGAGMLEARTKRISIGIQSDAERTHTWPVLCATHEGTISLSSDHGASWWGRRLEGTRDSADDSKLLTPGVRAKACAVFENRTFVATDQGLLILVQGENSQTTRILPSLGDVNDVEAREDGTLAVAGTEGILVSNDRGDSWMPVSAPAETFVRVSRSGDTVAALGTSLYVGTLQGGLASRPIDGTCHLRDVALTPQGSLHVACFQGLATAARAEDTPIVRSGSDGLPSSPNLGSVASWGEALALVGGSGVLWRIDTPTFSGRTNEASQSGLGSGPRSLVAWGGTHYVATDHGVSRWDASARRWVHLGATGLPTGDIKKLVATNDKLYVVTTDGAASLSTSSDTSWTTLTIATHPVADLAWNGSTLGAWVPTSTSKVYVLNGGATWESPSVASSCLMSFVGTNISGSNGTFYVGSDNAGAKFLTVGPTPTCDAIGGLSVRKVVGVAELAGLPQRKIYLATDAGLMVWDGNPSNPATVVTSTALPTQPNAGFVAIAQLDGTVAALHSSGDLVWTNDSEFRVMRRYDGLPAPFPSANIPPTVSLVMGNVFVSQPAAGAAWGPALPTVPSVTLRSATDVGVSLDTALREAGVLPAIPSVP